MIAVTLVRVRRQPVIRVVCQECDAVLAETGEVGQASKPVGGTITLRELNLIHHECETP